MQSDMIKLKDQEFLISYCDWNGHILQFVEGSEGVHGGSVKGYLNLKILVIFLPQIHSSTNVSHIVTFHCGNNQSH